MRLAATALRWRRERRPALVVELRAVRGSAPRAAGTRMLVAADAVEGTIGGGHLELKAIERARALLRGEALAPEWAVPLGPALGQCCGGHVTLAFVPLSDCPEWPLPAPRFVLELHGAGHVGRAIVRLLDEIPCRVRWIDERDEAFDGLDLPPHIEPVVAASAPDEAARAPAGACHLVLTHRHDLDLEIVHTLLRRADTAFVGLIGSQTKRERFRARLAERGHTSETLARLVCPIGLPGIAGKEPAVIAVAVVAQLLALQR
ncbi:xanthine dehydrogenase accessory protein XdhC [Rubrivivax gelatinosus]|uniref:xanthine dehydrogenase accessory protein XdhC n=1 Tax=Rubrivivax gelatinosus TaxID=28068 RepID=UPI0019069D56|nr:xanthine dehydrogenase accessory protein XdhC [Rubrivivax gelatinosus]MBK1612288.1 xanthine dehydrogenase accessory protein XdhC [Rubrivivax gelatinosus]